MTSCVNSYPPELLSTICAHVFAAGQPSSIPSLDPLFLQEAGVPSSLPSSYPPANWPEPVARRALANLSLVSRAWSEAAKPWLWRKIEVRLPRSWLALVEEIAGDEDEEANVEQAALVVDRSISEAAKAALAMRTATGEELDQDAAMKLKESILESLSGPDSSIPPELLSHPRREIRVLDARRANHRRDGNSCARFQTLCRTLWVATRTGCTVRLSGMP